MQIIPWRVKNFISEHFPLAYHLSVNSGLKGNSQNHWNTRLTATWDDLGRKWPAKVDAISHALDYEMSIIDIGCGTGSILRDLLQRGFVDLNGLEISEYSVRRLSDQGISMSRGNLLDMPFPKATFDAAIASEVLEHVIRRGRFVNEITRIVKPSGIILIFVPDDTLGPIDEPEHVIKYNATSLRYFLSKFMTIETIMSIIEPHNGAKSLFAVCRNVSPHQRPGLGHFRH